MSNEVVQVDSGHVTVALGRFQLGLKQNASLLQQLGLRQIAAAQATIREQGYPGNSFAPLAASTIKRDPKKYGAGHKILIDRGSLINSFTATVSPGQVVVGTKLAKARALQFGTQGTTMRIGRRKRTFQRAIRYERVEMEGRDGTKYKVPRPVTKGKEKALDLKGHATRHARLEGPLAAPESVNVKEHDRAGGLPPRPFLIVRADYVDLMRDDVNRYIASQRKAAGLAGKDGV